MLDYGDLVGAVGMRTITSSVCSEVGNPIDPKSGGDEDLTIYIGRVLRVAIVKVMEALLIQDEALYAEGFGAFPAFRYPDRQVWGNGQSRWAGKAIVELELCPTA